MLRPPALGVRGTKTRPGVARIEIRVDGNEEAAPEPIGHGLKKLGLVIARSQPMYQEEVSGACLITLIDDREVASGIHRFRDRADGIDLRGFTSYTTQ